MLAQPGLQGEEDLPELVGRQRRNVGDPGDLLLDRRPAVGGDRGELRREPRRVPHPARRRRGRVLNALADLGDPGRELAVAAPVGLQGRVRGQCPVGYNGPGDGTRRGLDECPDLVGGGPRGPGPVGRSAERGRGSGRCHHPGDVGRGPVEDCHEVVGLHHTVGHLPVRERHRAGGDHGCHTVSGPETLDQRREVRVCRRDEEFLDVCSAGQRIHRVQHQVDVGAGLAPLREGGAVDDAEPARVQYGLYLE